MFTPEEVLKRQIYGTQKDIDFYKTHIEFLKSMQIKKPELECAFGDSYSNLINADVNAQKELQIKLDRYQKKLLEMEVKQI